MQGKKPRPLRPREAEELWRAFHDHETFCRESITIRDKYGKAVPLILQPAQQRLNEIIGECRRKRKPVRIIVLKARQVMVSTATAAQFFHQVPFNAGQHAEVVAHDEKATKKIFRYYHQIQSGYKPFRGVAGLPELTKDAEEKGQIEWANGSKIHIHTAGNVKGGRAGSTRYLHLSEYAFWPNAKTLMTGLMQSVPSDPDTIVVIESTANGVGNDFHQRWLEASDPSSESDWIAFFFAWWQHPEYALEPADPRAFEESLSEDERELAQKHNLTLAQLNWRRWCIRNNCGGSVDTFRQEYPSHPEEAFLFSGRPRFSHKHLGRMPIDREGIVGDIFEEQNGPAKITEFRPNDDGGALTIYKKPAPRKRYTIGVDVAEGIDAGAGVLGATDPDYSVAIVLDMDTGEEVAQLRGRIEPGPFAEYVAVLAAWYNWAYVIPEANGPGIAFLEVLLRSDFPPSLIYHRRPQPDEQFTSEASNALQKLGFRSSAVTKVQLMSVLDQAIRHMDVIIRNPGTLLECQTFVYKPSGRMEATEGCHDDRVIALALAHLGRLEPPPDRRLAELKKYQAPAAQAASSNVRRYGQRRLPERGSTIRF